MANLFEVVPQALVDLLVAILPTLIAILGIWLVGKFTGLWALIKNELVKRKVKQFASKLILETEIDEIVEASLDQWNDALFERMETYFQKRGIPVELDEVEEIVADVIRDIFIYLEEIVEDESNTPEDLQGPITN